MVADLLFNVIASLFLIAYAVYVYNKLSIRLNQINRIKWLIALIAIMMRLALSIVELVRHDYSPGAFKYYFLWVIDQAHFMIMLTLFFTVIGSWQIMFSF